MCYLGGIWRRLEPLDPAGRFTGVPSLGKPLYIEKTVYITTHKTAINRPMDHTGKKQHILCKVSCFWMKSFRFRRLRKTIGFFPYKSLYFECYATMPMVADAHISSLGYLWYEWYRTSKSKCFFTQRIIRLYLLWLLFILRTVFLCTSSFLIWSIEP